MSLLIFIDITRNGVVEKFNIVDCMRMLSPTSNSSACELAVNETDSWNLLLLNNSLAMSLAIA